MMVENKSGHVSLRLSATLKCLAISYEPAVCSHRQSSFACQKKVKKKSAQLVWEMMKRSPETIR